MVPDKLGPTLDFRRDPSLRVTSEFPFLDLLAERFDVELSQKRVVNERDTKVDGVSIRIEFSRETESRGK